MKHIPYHILATTKWESGTIFRSTYAVLGCRPNLTLLSITCRRKSHQTNILFCSKAKFQLLFCSKAKFQRFRDWNHCIRTTLCQCVSQCLLVDIRNHNLVFSSFMICYWVCNKSNMTDVTSGAGNHPEQLSYPRFLVVFVLFNL